jgi:two-component system chemotaxis response regulator CheB
MSIRPDLPSDDCPEIRVMVVDDSAVIRGSLARILESDPDIRVITTAPNGQIAIDNLKKLQHDVILLDVEMPIMDGLTTIPHLMKTQPNVKIIMCSTLTTENAQTSLKAMELGAVDCIAKPTSTQDIYSRDAFREILIGTVKAVAPRRRPSAGLSSLAPKPATPTPPSATSAPPPLSPAQQASVHPDKHKLHPTMGKTVTLRSPTDGFMGKPDLLAIGSSTGGPNALFAVISHLKGVDIPIILTQHMPPTFTRILAEHISQNTGVPAVEATEGMPVLPGRIHVAAGGFHMVLQKTGTQVTLHLDNGPMENFCRPAVDPMLRSAIKIYGNKIMTVILTGMGQDGLRGSRDIVAAGGRVIAQDEATSVVWGMPGAVSLDGICSSVLPLPEIGPHLRKSVLRLP